MKYGILFLCKWTILSIRIPRVSADLKRMATDDFVCDYLQFLSVIICVLKGGF
ncbi:MAG: hypothetical protein WCY05_04500 [Candidatus Omnitrophota bacterium]